MKPIAHWKTQQKLQDYASHLKAEKPENLPTGNKNPKGSGIIIPSSIKTNC
jgi:hypothetical protein